MNFKHTLKSKFQKITEKYFSGRAENKKINENGSETPSRRDFIRKMGLGTALGTLAMTPMASGFTFRSSDGFSLKNPSDSDFIIDSDGTILTDNIGKNSNPIDSLNSKYGEFGKLNVNGISSSKTAAIGQGKENLYSSLMKNSAPGNGERFYNIHAEIDATGNDSDTKDQTSIYSAVKTDEPDVWALNPLVQITSDKKEGSAYAIEANVNDNSGGIGNGILVSGVGDKNPQNAFQVTHGTSKWTIGYLSQSVSDAHFRTLDEEGNIQTEIQGDGDLNMSGNEIFDVEKFRNVDEIRIGNSVFLSEPSQSKIQETINNAEDDSCIEIFGDVTLDSLKIDGVNNLTLKFNGKITVESGNTGLIFGENSLTLDGFLKTTSIQGPGMGDGRAVLVKHAPGWEWDFGTITGFDKAIQVLRSDSSHEPLDWTLNGGRIQSSTRAIEFYAKADYIQGWDVHGVNIFNISDTSVKHRGDNRSTLHWFSACTLHGNTNQNNNAEIHYGAASSSENNRYELKFLGGSDNSKSGSKVEYLN